MGCRREEIGGLRWDEVLDDRIIIATDRRRGGDSPTRSRLWMVVRIRAKMAQRKKLAWPLRASQPLLAVERLVANDGWVASRVKAVSRRRRGPQARLYRACHPAILGHRGRRLTTATLLPPPSSIHAAGNTALARDRGGVAGSPEKPAGHVFGRFSTGFSGWSRSKQALDLKLAKAGVEMPPWTLHDLRRTFSTDVHDAGVEPLVIEALLAHKQQGVAAVYNRASFGEASPP